MADKYSLTFNDTEMTSVKFDGVEMDVVKINNVIVYKKKYAVGITEGTGVASVTVTASDGTVISDGDEVYYGETLTVLATASTGYTIDSYTTSYTVTSDVNIDITATANTYTISENLTNVISASTNPTSATYGSTVTLQYSAPTGYSLPTSVTVTGSTNTWDSTTGTLVLKKVQGAISIAITGVVVETTVEAPTFETDLAYNGSTGKVTGYLINSNLFSTTGYITVYNDDKSVILGTATVTIGEDDNTGFEITATTASSTEAVYTIEAYLEDSSGNTSSTTSVTIPKTYIAPTISNATYSDEAFSCTITNSNAITLSTNVSVENSDGNVIGSTTIAIPGNSSSTVSLTPSSTFTSASFEVYFEDSAGDVSDTTTQDLITFTAPVLSSSIVYIGASGYINLTVTNNNADYDLPLVLKVYDESSNVLLTKDDVTVSKNGQAYVTINASSVTTAVPYSVEAYFRNGMFLSSSATSTISSYSYSKPTLSEATYDDDTTFTVTIANKNYMVLTAYVSLYDGDDNLLDSTSVSISANSTSTASVGYSSSITSAYFKVYFKDTLSHSSASTTIDVDMGGLIAPVLSNASYLGTTGVVTVTNNNSESMTATVMLSTTSTSSGSLGSQDVTVAANGSKTVTFATSQGTYFLAYFTDSSGTTSGTSVLQRENQLEAPASVSAMWDYNADTSRYELLLTLTNNNSTSVTAHCSAQGATQTVTSFTVSANATTTNMYLGYNTDTEQADVSVYFSATGYADSDSVEVSAS